MNIKMNSQNLRTTRQISCIRIWLVSVFFNKQNVVRTQGVIVNFSERYKFRLFARLSSRSVRRFIAASPYAVFAIIMLSRLSSGCVCQRGGTFGQAGIRAIR